MSRRRSVRPAPVGPGPARPEDRASPSRPQTTVSPTACTNVPSARSAVRPALMRTARRCELEASVTTPPFVSSGTASSASSAAASRPAAATPKQGPGPTTSQPPLRDPGSRGCTHDAASSTVANACPHQSKTCAASLLMCCRRSYPRPRRCRRGQVEPRGCPMILSADGKRQTKVENGGIACVNQAKGHNTAAHRATTRTNRT